MQSNMSISFRLLYDINELKSDYFMAFLIWNEIVLKINTSAHCAGSKWSFSETLSLGGIFSFYKEFHLFSLAALINEQIAFLSTFDNVFIS